MPRTKIGQTESNTCLALLFRHPASSDCSQKKFSTPSFVLKATAKDYEARIWYSEIPGDDCYVAQVNDMPGIMAHGDFPESAAKEIQEVLQRALDTYTQNNEELPAPKSIAAASLGRFGGSAKSSKKSLAARINGRRGGQPKKAERKSKVKF
jgi:predicted RNase H-like HicB family nuclease